MKIAIVDDEPCDLDQIAGLINEYASKKGLDIELSAFGSAEEFLEDFRSCTYNAVFLDICMVDMTGIDAAGEIQKLDRDILIIFLTSSLEFMGHAFSMHVFDYLEKPADKNRVFQLMDDILLRIFESESGPALEFTINKNDIRLPYDDICVVRSAGHRITITDTDDITYEPRIAYSSVCHTLSSDPRFLELLRGVTVNMDQILSLSGDSCNLKNGMTLPVRVKKSGELEKTWQNYKLDRLRRTRKERRAKNNDG